MLNINQVTMVTSESCDKIYPILFEVKKQLKALVKSSSNPHFRSTYADLNTHLDEIEPALEAKGCFVMQPPTALHNENHVISRIIHAESGQWVEGSMRLTELENMQKLGGAVTYARRYILGGLLSLKAEDDDGNTAVGLPATGAQSFAKQASGGFKAKAR